MQYFMGYDFPRSQKSSSKGFRVVLFVEGTYTCRPRLFNISGLEGEIDGCYVLSSETINVAVHI